METKNKIGLALLAIILIAGGFFLYGNRGSDVEPEIEEEESSEVRSGEVEVLGVIACLEYNIRVTGQECVKALKGDDGKMYALNSNEATALSEGTKVRAIGTFEPADQSVDDASVFSYDGVLKARILKRR